MDDEFIIQVTEEELAQFPEEEGNQPDQEQKYPRIRTKERDTPGKN